MSNSCQKFESIRNLILEKIELEHSLNSDRKALNSIVLSGQLGNSWKVDLLTIAQAWVDCVRHTELNVLRKLKDEDIIRLVNLNVSSQLNADLIYREEIGNIRLGVLEYFLSGGYRRYISWEKQTTAVRIAENSGEKKHALAMAEADENLLGFGQTYDGGRFFIFKDESMLAVDSHGLYVGKLNGFFAPKKDVNLCRMAG